MARKVIRYGRWQTLGDPKDKQGAPVYTGTRSWGTKTTVFNGDGPKGERLVMSGADRGTVVTPVYGSAPGSFGGRKR